MPELKILLKDLEAKAKKFRGDDTIVVSLVGKTIEVVGIYSTHNRHNPFTSQTDHDANIASLSIYPDGPLEGLLWEKSGRSSYCGFNWKDELDIRDALKAL